MASKKKATRPDDLSVQILAGIRADLQAVREDLKHTVGAMGAEVAQVKESLDRLERRSTDADVRVATELTAMAGANALLIDAIRALGSDMKEVKRIVSDIRDDRARMNLLEARLVVLEAKAS
jgi:hypothetical protein